MSRAPAMAAVARRLDRDRHDDADRAVGGPRLDQRARVLRDQQRRLRAAAGAPPAAARSRGAPAGWPRPARRSGSRPAAATAAPRSSSSRRSRAARCSRQRLDAPPAAPRAPTQVGQRQRADLARRRGARRASRRRPRAQRAGQLVLGGAQAGVEPRPTTSQDVDGPATRRDRCHSPAHARDRHARQRRRHPARHPGRRAGRRPPARAAADPVLHGLGLVVLVIGVDNALAWRDTNALFVLGGVLLGGLAGEALRIEDRLAGASATGCRRASHAPRRARTRRSARASSPPASLFCVGALAVVGSIQDGLTGNYRHALHQGPARRLRLGRAGRRPRLGRRASRDQRAGLPGRAHARRRACSTPSWPRAATRCCR